METISASSLIKVVAALVGGGTSCLVLFKLIYRLSTGVYKSDKILFGKTVLVTGANRGIGRATVKDLANRKARVIMACRNVEQGLKVAKEIQNETGNSEIVVVKLDLSSFKSVRHFAQHILNTEEHLHILINNAAIVSSETNQMTQDGIELHYATNYFGPFLLTMLLLPLLLKSSPSRIINLSSVLHFWGNIDATDMYGEATCGPVTMYSNTKLANILFTKILSRRLAGTGVTVNAVHPGNTETSIANNLPKWMLFFGPMVKALMVKSVEEGAQTTIFASLSEDLNGISGDYLADCRITFSSPMSKNEALQQRLWDLSLEITGFGSENNAKFTQISNGKQKIQNNH